MSQDPMDILIGADETEKGDTEAAMKHVQAGKAAEASGDRAKCIAEYRKAVSADPHNPTALFSLAFQLDLAGEDDEAIVLYERACKSRSAPVNALINLAVLYEDAGDYHHAEKCLRQILDTNPNHPRARLFMKDVQASRTMFYDEEHDRDLAKRNALLDTPVTDFELSVRARNCLKKMNIRTLGDLLRVSEAELLAYKNFGETSLTEIRQMLASKGLRLGQRIEEQQRAIRREVFDAAKASNSEHLLNKAVTDLNLSVRARKALQVLNIRTVGELASRTEAELMGVKNFGATSLVEIRAKLQELGLSLRELKF
ncbi:MAG: DNA-directed RNA polymerase subunit alpha C-terminal domain-containing protein [Planctomycetota bacterium]|nr:DNA-directed RNA polymerase subunit alpha C-terminal domain-containing protein [Planctomycetota bacterium]